MQVAETFLNCTLDVVVLLIDVLDFLVVPEVSQSQSFRAPSLIFLKLMTNLLSQQAQSRFFVSFCFQLFRLLSLFALFDTRAFAFIINIPFTYNVKHSSCN